jgi:hypothetical protein
MLSEQIFIIQHRTKQNENKHIVKEGEVRLVLVGVEKLGRVENERPRQLG